MKKQILKLVSILGLVFTALTIHAENITYSLEKQSFNANWQFAIIDNDQAAKPSFNDAKWRTISLPHDWAIEGPFSKKYSARNGGLPVFGTAWYRKRFVVPKQAEGKRVTVTFDGVMANSEVYVNGQLAGKRPFGYIGFAYDITDLLVAVGSENVIAVKTAPENYASRWYPGSGIYRNTWIELDNQTHIAQWETQISTPNISTSSAKVIAKTQINSFANAGKYDVSFDILDADERLVTAVEQTITTQIGNKNSVEAKLTIDQPIRWDVDNPYRYKVITTLRKDGNVIDTDIQPLGVRSIEYKADDGFWLNGRRVQIQGVCLHHDNGPLGAVVNERAIERKLEIMQAMGVNSVRTAHNPPSPELVELADKMGILLQIEAFDTWKKPKHTVVNGYHKYYDEWSEQDLTDTVRIHRNNPSVIMWSIGNEIYEQKRMMVGNTQSV